MMARSGLPPAPAERRASAITTGKRPRFGATPYAVARIEPRGCDDGAQSPGAFASKLLHPWPQLELEGPGAAVLLHEVQVARGHGVGIEQGVGAVGGLRAPGAADAAVDHHM